MGTKLFSDIITFTRASSATRVNSSGLVETVASNQPRFDYDPVTLQPKGLLIEEQRTNSIRNNTMQGAVAGTPGTVPTNWPAAIAGSGLTISVAGTGYESGINYIDFRVYGTSNASGDFFIANFEGTTFVSALNGQTWAYSAYVSIVGGSMTGVDSVQMRLSERNSSGGNLVDGRQSITPTSGSLTTKRQTFVRTNTNASTAYLYPSLLITQTLGATIDITLRIGLPQLEQGAFTTSVIPTSGTAATRAADVATMTGTNFSSWYNQTEGTLFAEVDSYPSGGTTQRRILYAGVSSDRMDLRFATDGVSTGFNVFVGGVSQAAITGTGAASLTKIAGAYKSNDFAAATNSVLGTPDTSGSLPVVSQLAIGSNGSSEAVNGHLKRIAYFPRRLSNAELQAITA